MRASPGSSDVALSRFAVWSPPTDTTVAPYAATVALAVSLHGPVAPLVLTQRER